MKTTWAILTAAALVLGGMTLAGQESEKDHQHKHEGGQRKDPAMGMDMQQMMPMMREMHQRHAAMANAWAASENSVFVLRSGKLLKYDEDLKLVKTVDLPKAQTETEQAAGEGGQTGAPPRRQATRQRMQQMMAQMHGGLAPRIEVVRGAVLVSHGSQLLKYDRDLELQAEAELPDVPTMRCPMCEMMMQRMQGTAHRNTEHN